jgi:hypothetical protein
MRQIRAKKELTEWLEEERNIAGCQSLMVNQRNLN